MTNDANIHEQIYRYFLQEAPELLQVIEQELFSLRENFHINKVYTLMRATHTLKGAAASIGLDTIKTVAHSLEDIFKAICTPDLSIDSEVEGLLFESYECLRLSLTAEVMGGIINDSEVLERTSAIFAQLQEKLGDCFDLEAHIPNSQELGFDLTQSIFEVGVSQRLEQLATAIASDNPQQITTILRTQADVFLGLAQSLNLPGFEAIAQAVLSALNNYPGQAVIIARVALSNFHEARTAVLNGDRTQGGQPSLALRKLSSLENQSFPEFQNTPVNSQKSVTEITLEAESHTEESALDEVTIEPDSQTPPPQPPISSSTPTVRIQVEHLEQLNYLIGELLTNQNRQSLQNEQLWMAIRGLVTKLQQHQQLLHQLQDLCDDHSSVPQQQLFVHHRQNHHERFDSLELNNYSEFYHFIQLLLEDSVQLGEATEAIEMFARQSQETLEKQRRLLTNSRDSLMEARMLPLKQLFERFPQILSQLEFIHKKQITLNIHGSDALVDKAVVEKLYDPLLHLLRNAFDHGIEPPITRQTRGKPEKGQIDICAYHQGRYLVVEVQDDGQGLDFEKIRAKAVESQLISPEQAPNLNESQLKNLIFEPGFSTASGVNDLSGRGIGLDVVRSHLQAIQGSVTVHSRPQQGTTFKLQIPLSLTIANLLLCQAGDQIYALFANSIEEVLIPTTDQIRTWEGGKVLHWGKGASTKLIPIYQLAKILNYSSSVTQSVVFGSGQSHLTQKKGIPLILIRCQDKLLALEVDQFIGEQELVIRPLGTMIVPPRYIYGSSVLADGRLTLVLDGSVLMECFSQQQTDDHINSNLASTPLILTSRLEQPQLSSQTRVALPQSPNSNKQRQKITILLVDDSITARQTLAFTLQKAGYVVLEAKDGYEAIEQLRHHTNIQLVFCDIEMPRMNGFEFLQNRQLDSTLADIPVVMVTSRSSEKHRHLAFQLGANAYITKPYLEHILLATLADILKKNTQVVARRD
jgi:two-component system, chemotaxis family, sensor histidine kinase and response regulator PixL